ncbi:TPA: DUF551 domain-containing protein [Klebsiella pneumoniae]
MPPAQPVADSEPVAWLLSGGGAKNVVCFDSGNAYADPLREVTPLYRHAQPAPVVPDGYVMVPEEPTESMVIAGFESEPDEFFSESEVWEAYQKMSGCEQAAFRARLCWRAMLAAAPQEDINALIPLVSRNGQGGDRWIPVSERMPDDDDFVYIWPRPDFGVELHVGQYCECSPKGDGWYAQVYEQNYGIEWHPITVTHWMPLPAGPQGVKGE